MLHPKKLTDLKHVDNKIYICNNTDAQTIANRWFHEIFGPAPVSCNVIFQEEDADYDEEDMPFVAKMAVYECYQDPGSVDYLYIIQG